MFSVMVDCIFCKIVEGKIPADIVYEDDGVLAFNDVSPQAPVHILVIPKSHFESVNELSGSHADIISRLVLTAKMLAAKYCIAKSGYRLVVNCNAEGGQTVFHLHIHLLGGRQLKALG